MFIEILRNRDADLAHNISKVLFIDDDDGLQIVVGDYLEDNGYKVIGAQSGEEAKAALKDHDDIDVILLDLGLPDVQGFTLLPELTMSRAPVIIVSGKTDTTEKIVGLEMGADDYMTKPFEMRELSARIKAVLRRSEKTESAPVATETPKQDKTTPVKFKEFYLDPTQYQVFDTKGQSLDFTTGEYNLLDALARSPNHVLTREHLFELTRDGKFDVYDRAIDIQVARIRKKLSDAVGDKEVIKTVRGVGYMLSTENM